MNVLNPIRHFCATHGLTAERAHRFAALACQVGPATPEGAALAHVGIELRAGSGPGRGDIRLLGPFAAFRAHGEGWLASADGMFHEDNLRETLQARGFEIRKKALPLPADAVFDGALVAAFKAFFQGGSLEQLAPEPVAMSLDDFLCGATEADPWCRQSFEDYIDDIDTEYDPQTLMSIGAGYAFAESSDSILLLHEGTVVGYYNCPGAVCVMDEHQGQGLGAELILHAYLSIGTPPTQALDEQMFSEAGLAAHRKAWQLGMARGIFIEPKGNRPALAKC